MPFELPQPSEPVEVETRKTIVNDESDSGLRIALRKSKPFRFFTLNMNNREQEEFDGLSDFWEETYPKGAFAWTNEDCDVSNALFYINSPLNSKPDGHDMISYALTLKAKDPVTYSTPANNILPSDPDFGHEVTQDKVILVSDSPGGSRKAAARSVQRRKFRMEFNDREMSEFLALENFWCYHYPGKQISLSVGLQAYNLHLDGDFWIASNLKWSVFPTHFDYSFEILEV